MTALATALGLRKGVQMHGGIDTTDEHDIGFHRKHAPMLAEMLGGATFRADRIAWATGY